MKRPFMILFRNRSGIVLKKGIWVPVAALALLLAGFLAGKAIRGGGWSREGFFAPAYSPSAQTVSAERAGALAVAAQSVLPAVVSIETEYEPLQRRSNDAFENFFRDFLGERRSDEYNRKHSVGSGVVISPDGLVLTAEHVVEGASSIFAALPDGRYFQLKLLGDDPLNDVALLKIDGESIPYVALGDSDILVQGEWLIAAGNPFGLMAGDPQPTITAGIVSALMRTIQIDDGQGKKAYHGLIQTDASINPGNSGGPLVNARGELVGINNAIFSTSGGSQGIGFAIPVNTCKSSIESILKNGEVKRGWLGVGVTDMDEGMKLKYRLEGVQGVIVTKVFPQSAAEKAGLLPGQIITSFNGISVKNTRWWNGLSMRVTAGQEVVLSVWEGGKTQERSFHAPAFLLDSALKNMGIQNMKPLTYEFAIRHNIRPEKGLVLLALNEKGNLYQAGLRKNDVLRVVGGRKIYEEADLEVVLSRLLPGEELELIAERRGYYFKTQIRW